MEENNTTAPPPHQNPNHEKDYPHHHVHHNHNHTYHNDNADNDNHDNEVIDIVEVPKKPSHGDDDDDDNIIDLESPTEATHNDDDVVDLESATKGEGESCKILTVVDSRFCSSSALDLLIAGNGRFRCTQYTIAKGANHNHNHNHNRDDSDSDNDSDENKLLFRLDQRGCLLILKDKLFMVDDTNQPVLSIKRKVKGFLRNERQVFRGDEFKDGGELFRIRRSKFLQIKTSLDVYLQTNINQDNHDETIQKHIQNPSPDYVVKVSWFGSSIDMFHGSKAIAQVRRKSTGWLGKKTFYCSLQPEVDYSFVVAMTIIANSIYKEYTLGIFTAIINVLVSISDFLPSIV